MKRVRIGERERVVQRIYVPESLIKAMHEDDGLLATVSYLKFDS